MKMYRVGNHHHVTQDDAKKAAKAAGTNWAAVEVPTKIRELADYINALVDDVVEQTVPLDVLAAIPAPAPVEHKLVSYTELSLNIDDLWDGLPLARKLSFAALAVEDARELTPVMATAPNPAPVADASDLL